MKKILFIILILIISILPNSVSAREIPAQSQSGAYCAKGDKILSHYEKLTTKQMTIDEIKENSRFLVAAKYFYYQANMLDVANVNALIGLARIELLHNNFRGARNNLMAALNINESNPKVNFYLGETFFKDGEYTEAVRYYNQAYKYGYRTNYTANLMLGRCYEKLNDVTNARYHYKNAVRIMPESVEANVRLQGLDAINRQKNVD